MQIIECQECETRILVPRHALKAIVRCPHCDHEFSLSDVPEGQPIAVAQVVRSEMSGRGSEETTTPTDDAPVATEIDQEVDRLFRDDDTPKPNFNLFNEPVSASSIAVDVPSPFDDNSPSGSSLQTASHRLKKRKSNGLAEILKIAGGGVAGILIAQLILWWMPGKWRTDPIKLAPKLPESIAFLAPESLRQIPTSSSVINRPTRDRDLAKTVLNRTQHEQNPTSNTNVVVDLDSANKSSVGLLTNEMNDSGEIDDLPHQFELPTDEILDGASTEKPLAGLQHVPILTIKEFDVHFRQASAALSELKADDRNSTKQKTLYRTLSELARTVTFLDRAEQGAADRLASTESFLREVSEDSYRSKVIGVGAHGWIKYRRRTTSGIVVTCEVTKITKQGDVFEVTGDILGRQDSPITILSLTNPTEDVRYPFDVGSNVILLGMIAEDAATQIHGYTGNESTVVWKGLHMLIE